MPVQVAVVYKIISFKTIQILLNVEAIIALLYIKYISYGHIKEQLLLDSVELILGTRSYQKCPPPMHCWDKRINRCETIVFDFSNYCSIVASTSVYFAIGRFITLADGWPCWHNVDITIRSSSATHHNLLSLIAFHCFD